MKIEDIIEKRVSGNIRMVMNGFADFGDVLDA